MFDVNINEWINIRTGQDERKNGGIKKEGRKEGKKEGRKERRKKGSKGWINEPTSKQGNERTNEWKHGSNGGKCKRKGKRRLHWLCNNNEH